MDPRKFKSWSVRAAYVESQETPPEWYDDKAAEVRCAMASHPNAPPEMLERLAQDRRQVVRANVADNPSTPPSVLRYLASDRERTVTSCVARSPNAPPDILERLVSRHPDQVAHNPSAPLRVRFEGARRGYFQKSAIAVLAADCTRAIGRILGSDSTK